LLSSMVRPSDARFNQEIRSGKFARSLMTILNPSIMSGLLSPVAGGKLVFLVILFSFQSCLLGGFGFLLGLLARCCFCAGYFSCGLRFFPRLLGLLLRLCCVLLLS